MTNNIWISNPDLERAVTLVLKAGLSTGHAGDCEELIREVLLDVQELRAKAAKQSSEDRRNQLAGQIIGPLMIVMKDGFVRQLNDPTTRDIAVYYAVAVQAYAIADAMIAVGSDDQYREAVDVVQDS